MHRQVSALPNISNIYLVRLCFFLSPSLVAHARLVLFLLPWHLKSPSLLNRFLCLTVYLVESRFLSNWLTELRFRLFRIVRHLRNLLNILLLSWLLVPQTELSAIFSPSLVVQLSGLLSSFLLFLWGLLLHSRLILRRFVQRVLIASAMKVKLLLGLLSRLLLNAPGFLFWLGFSLLTLLCSSPSSSIVGTLIRSKGVSLRLLLRLLLRLGVQHVNLSPPIVFIIARGRNHVV